MRTWLTVIIVLLIVGVVLDGVRRMRQSRRSSLKMSRSIKQGSYSESDRDGSEEYGSELPNGGARVVTVREPDDTRQLNRQVKQSSESSREKPGRPQRLPEQVALNLEQTVPMLMESVDEETPDPVGEANSGSELVQDDAGSESPLSELGGFTPDDLDLADESGRIEPSFYSDLLDDSVAAVRQQAAEPKPVAEAREKEVAPQRAVEKAAPQRDEQEGETQSASEYIEPEVVLVINVMAPKGVKFSGGALLDVVLEEGMRLGNMNIFHRHSDADGEGSPVFSMANIVVPGTFDLNTMRDMVTPGVSLFLALPLEADYNSLTAFEQMLRTARVIASSLGGELKDENRSVMTSQTVEHYRQRIREFERKQLSRAPA